MNSACMIAASLLLFIIGFWVGVVFGKDVFR